ncbi:MAG: OmpH family outer membrane protein [Proteobacteria bacterium]|nr:OmpH family outer membrane protein [Pseudomonadota bacterium]
MGKSFWRLVAGCFMFSWSLMGAVSVAFAEGAAVEKFYIVDLQQVIDQAVVTKSIRAELQAEMKKREDILAEKRSSVEKLKADLHKQASLLSQSAVAERQDTIARRERELAGEFDAQREEMARKTDAQMKKILAQIDLVVSELAKDKGNAIIIERDPRLVLYSSSSLDITTEVVKRLNEKKLG